jgi:hypothetical protein
MNEERDGSKFLGRDHNPNVFSVWMAGGGVKRGFAYGETDELGAKVVKDPVHVRDLQATVLHLLGISDHTRLTWPARRPRLPADRHRRSRRARPPRVIQ